MRRFERKLSRYWPTTASSKLSFPSVRVFSLITRAGGDTEREGSLLDLAGAFVRTRGGGAA